MDDPAELRAKAEHYRELAQSITDARAHAGIIRLCEEYEALAAKLDGGSVHGGEHWSGIGSKG